MAKDAKGADLKLGDEVMIPCVVTELIDAEDGHNVSLRTKGLLSAEAKQTTNLALNSRQVLKGAPR